MGLADHEYMVPVGPLLLRDPPCLLRRLLRELCPTPSTNPTRLQSARRNDCSSTRSTPSRRSAVLCTSQGVAQLAAAAAQRFPAAAVDCHYLDLYRAEKARRYAGDGLANLTIGCSADFPPQAVDLAALPFSAQGEAELTRELLQEAHQRLEPGGTLITSTDNPCDRWLHAEMRKLFAAVTRRQSSQGTVYLARRDRPLKRVKDFRCNFAFRDRGRLIQAVSRPGVFSHREVDPGARQLMAAMEIAAGDRVLDMGCGSGTVSLAAAFRAEGVEVLAVDSHARAVECTALGAAKNGLGNDHGRAQRAAGRSAVRGASMSSWRIRPIMPGFASPASSWKRPMRPCAAAAGSSSSASSPRGTPSTCRSGSARLRSSPRRTIGSREGGGTDENGSQFSSTAPACADSARHLRFLDGEVLP